VATPRRWAAYHGVADDPLVDIGPDGGDDASPLMSFHRTGLPQPVEKEVNVGSAYAAVSHFDQNLFWAR
jgi:hypothetical protein